MGRLLLPFFLWLLSITVFAQESKETHIPSKIQEVTVFLSGAQVFETAEGQIDAGESTVLIKGLSPYLDEKSIQVKGKGEFTILAVNKRLDFLSGQTINAQVKALEEAILAIQQNQNKETARLDVLKEKSSLLNANKNIGGTQGSSLSELKQALDFYDTELMKLKAEELQIQANLQEESSEIERLQNQIRALSTSDNQSTSEVRIRIKAAIPGKASFQINYLVENAGWYPKYDIRVKNISTPLNLIYKAEVYQNTGVDWNNVKLRFSNGNPNLSGQLPGLEKWELNFARLTVYSRSRRTFNSISGKITGEDGPLPGAIVSIDGTTIGTATDANGNYNLLLPDKATQLTASFIGYQSLTQPINSPTMNIALIPDEQLLEEVVVTGYGAQRKVAGMTIRESMAAVPEAQTIQTRLQENQTTVEIEVNEPYSIRSNGEKSLVDLKTFEVPANYRYSTAPKIDNDVFLIAQLADWSQYSLLEGESNLYFEDGFVGRSILNAGSLQDTLEISMGRDRSIVIQRDKKEEFSKKRSIGSNITESRGYEITVRNNKSQPISLLVQDQIPISVNSEITVSALDISGGKLDSQTGIVTWEISVAPGQQQKLNLHYEVKYPKREKVNLD